jgi:hypothetical protein
MNEEQAMADGLIDLEDVELILAGKRCAGKTFGEEGAAR